MAEPARQSVAGTEDAALGGHAEVAEDFAREVQAVMPGVEVYAQWLDGVLDLWAVLRGFSLDERFIAAELAVAGVLGHVMDRHPEAKLDFLVLPEGSPLAECALAMGYTAIGAA